MKSTAGKNKHLEAMSLIVVTDEPLGRKAPSNWTESDPKTVKLDALLS